MASRGYRNNNPGNLEKGSFRFVGEIDPTDVRFRRFVSMPFGFRAVYKVLGTYINKYGLNTIPEMISRWAPPSENPTEVYIDFVSQNSGIPRSQEIQARDRERLQRIAYAIATFENRDAPQWSDVTAGWDLLDVYTVPDPNDPPGTVNVIKPDKKKTIRNLILLYLALLGSYTLYRYAKRQKISY